MAISGLIGMILPYVMIAVLAYIAYRWFKGRAKAAGKAIVKGAKVVGTTVVKGGKVVGQTAVKVSNKDDDMRKAAMKGDKKAIAKYGATLLIPGVAQVRAGKAVVNLIKRKKK